MSLEFFVATDVEVADLNNFENLVELIFRYEICASGANNFQDFNLLTKFFLQNNEDYIPKEIIKIINENLDGRDYIFKIYRLESKLVENIARIDKAKLNDPSSIHYWHSRGYFEQNIWNCVFGVNNLCNFAVRDNRNLYLVNDN